MIKNPLLDREFLFELDQQKEREIFARITALTHEELPIEFIEGKVTSGSINVDGQSAVRRTCQLSMVAQDININDFYWGLKNKFRLEVGLTNKIDSNYPDIIWFPQGLYVITSFSTNQSTNNYTINISGKDKMCLLNGDIAGALPHSVDFGVEEYYDADGYTHYTDIPIITIIREAVQNYGNELAQNIVINDIEDSGVEVLEYRGDKPIYLFREVNSDIFVNMTLNANQSCIIESSGITTVVSDEANIKYDNLIQEDLIDGIIPPTEIKLSERGNKYTIAKIEYGNIPGYRLTDLTYAGDLIANVGETLTSILDKIKNMLGEFEYFYDIDGRFIFQKKKNYVDVPWNPLGETDEVFAEAQINGASAEYSFTDSQLITSFQNTPNLLNLRNDFSVWGKRKIDSDIELPIHMRYAIDKKPTEYTTIRFEDNKTYTSDEYDWRELIYQMAKDYRKHYHDDDFLYRVATANPQYPDGHTGYEQYYVDMEGFWRDIYNRFEKDEDNQRNTLEIFKEENYWRDPAEKTYGWSKTVTDAPESLLFWFDFLDSENGDLSKYSIPAVGARTKAVNDNDVNAIYYREIPTVLFKSPNDKDYEVQTGYTYVNIQPYMENLFIISSKRKSAKEAIEEMLYKYSYCIESVNIQSIPVYYLEPNTRIKVRDNNSGINGEYIISKLTIPLAYNGMMSITATKAVTNII